MNTLFERLSHKKSKLAVVGLGYVGLPLSVEFGKYFSVIGFDISETKVAELQQNIDVTGEVDPAEIKSADLVFTTDSSILKTASFLVIAVPTPVDDSKKPDLSPLKAATKTVGQHLSAGSIVVFESTVYPGVTEDICVPILEKESGLICGRDFKVGYSPERMNPGDKEHSLPKLVKVVSGQDAGTLDTVSKTYAKIITAGVYEASSIKVAEAAKVIENTQRDLNIALMNELAIIFNKMGIDTREVIEAASTKWNFIRMFPGLVGGHCIGVDPYYLTYKAETLGYHPQVILAGRRINDEMGNYIAQQTVKSLIKAGKAVKGAKVLIMGLAFKENVADLRNTRVVDIVKELREFGVEVLVCDPLVDSHAAQEEYGLSLVDIDAVDQLDGIILANAHKVFKTISGADLRKKCRGESAVLVDIKGAYRDQKGTSEFVYWSL